MKKQNLASFDFLSSLNKDELWAVNQLALSLVYSAEHLVIQDDEMFEKLKTICEKHGYTPSYLHSHLLIDFAWHNRNIEAMMNFINTLSQEELGNFFFSAIVHRYSSDVMGGRFTPEFNLLLIEIFRRLFTTHYKCLLSNL